MKQKEFRNIYHLLIEKDELMDELLQNEIFLRKIKSRIQQINDNFKQTDIDDPKISEEIKSFLELTESEPEPDYNPSIEPEP